MFLQSISQNLADTVVVKFTHSLTKVSGVDPVTSSHWALVVPPINEKMQNIMKQKLREKAMQRKMQAVLKDIYKTDY